MKVVKASYVIRTPKQRLDEILLSLEDAGRTCYKSEDKITDESAPEFVDMITHQRKHR